MCARDGAVGVPQVLPIRGMAPALFWVAFGRAVPGAVSSNAFPTLELFFVLCPSRPGSKHAGRGRREKVARSSGRLVREVGGRSAG